MDTKKTKAELVNELIEARQHAAEVEQKLKEYERDQKIYTDGLEAGKQIKLTLNGLTDAGLSPDQAWELVAATIKAGLGGALR